MEVVVISSSTAAMASRYSARSCEKERCGWGGVGWGGVGGGGGEGAIIRENGLIASHHGHEF